MNHDDYIRRNWRNLPTKTMAMTLGKSPGFVEARARKLGLGRKKRNPYKSLWRKKDKVGNPETEAALVLLRQHYPNVYLLMDEKAKPILNRYGNRQWSICGSRTVPESRLWAEVEKLGRAT